MDDLIKIENDRPTVLARRLHEFLEAETDFRHWFPRMCDYGFNEEIDYKVLGGQKCPTNNPKNPWTTVTDYQLTIDMAKELCMIQRTERGKQARQYFLEVEKKWNDPVMVMSRALKMADVNVKKLEEQAKLDRPKVLFADSVSASPSTILVRELAKLLKQNGVDIGEKKLFKYLRENGFLIKKKGADYNSPTQRAMDMELFEVKETAITHSDGRIELRRTPKVTGRGQMYFVNKFREVTA